MKRIVGWLTYTFALFCVATLLMETMFLGSFLLGGSIDSHKLSRIIAILRGVDLTELIQQEAAAEQQRMQQAKIIPPSEEMKLRDGATNKKVEELLLVENRLKVSQRRFQEVQNEFGKRLVRLEESAKDNALTELKTTLELLDSGTAKSLMVHLIDTGKMDDVVEVLRRMTNAQQRKLFDQFQTDSEQQNVHEILRRLRQGDNVAQGISNPNL